VRRGLGGFTHRPWCPRPIECDLPRSLALGGRGKGAAHGLPTCAQTLPQQPRSRSARRWRHAARRARWAGPRRRRPLTRRCPARCTPACRPQSRPGRCSRSAATPRAGWGARGAGPHRRSAPSSRPGRSAHRLRMRTRGTLLTTHLLLAALAARQAPAEPALDTPSPSAERTPEQPKARATAEAAACHPPCVCNAAPRMNAYSCSTSCRALAGCGAYRALYCPACTHSGDPCRGTARRMRCTGAACPGAPAARRASRSCNAAPPTTSRHRLSPALRHPEIHTRSARFPAAAQGPPGRQAAVRVTLSICGPGGLICAHGLPARRTCRSGRRAPRRRSQPRARSRGACACRGCRGLRAAEAYAVLSRRSAPGRRRSCLHAASAVCSFQRRQRDTPAHLSAVSRWQR